MDKINQITCDSVTREKTSEGYLKVIVRAGRTGIQTYRCSQIGVADVNGTGYVNVLRHPDDVFSQISLDSLHGKDVTLQHPSEKLVNSKNFKSLSKGAIISPGKRIDNDIYVEAIIKDEESISALDKGFNQVSLGYKSQYPPESGSWEGIDYQFRQRNIFYNHLALVPKGRAGEHYIVLDEDDLPMNDEEKKALAGEVAKIVLDALKPATQEHQAVTTDDLDKMVEERTAIIEKALKIKPGIELSGKTNIQLMRECAGETVTLDHSDEIVKYAFDALRVTDTKPEPKKHKTVILGNGNLTSKSEHFTADSMDVLDESNQQFMKTTNRGSIFAKDKK